MIDGAPNFLATSFVVDQGKDGTIFPAAGGNSADKRVQAVYWRCIVVLYASARLTNPELGLRFYTNQEPPELDGRSVRSLLERYGVSIIIVPMTHRFADQRSKSWGNVLYFLDVMASFAAEAGNAALALIDSDVLVTAPVGGLFDQLTTCAFVGYGVHRPIDENINGMDRRAMTAFAADFFEREFPEPILDFGGELLATSAESWRQHGPSFERLYEIAVRGEGPAGSISTEEHLYSIIFAGLGDMAGQDRAVLKRLWTSRKFNTVGPGDERFALWHMPAEKRYGFAYIYNYLRDRNFDIAIPPAEFRKRAQRACGIPRASAAKHLKDAWHEGMRRLGR